MYASSVLTISRLLNPYQHLRNLTFTKCPSLRLLPFQRFLNATGKIQTNIYNHGHCGWSCTLTLCFSSTILRRRNPVHKFSASVVLRGGVNLQSVTPFSLKLKDSNFLQNYSGIRSVLCSKNPDLVDNDVIMTSSFLWWVSKIAKASLF